MDEHVEASAGAASSAPSTRQNPVRAACGAFLTIASSTGTSCVLLLLLGLLTWLGTLAQVELGLYEAQKRYFESFALVERVGPVPIPLPGGALVMGLLAVNLVVGGLARLRRGWATAGVLVAHSGILLLLASGFVKTWWAEDGHVTLFEGQSAAHFESWQRWEIAITAPQSDGSVRELVVPEEQFRFATGDAPARLASPELPFQVEVGHVLANAEPAPAGTAPGTPAVDGVVLRALPRETTAERNLAGAHVALIDPSSGARHAGLLWAAEREPLRVEFAGRTWSIALRHERYPLPFTLRLEDFRKEDHPGTAMPRSFESDVTIVEAGASRPLTISMNQPLRSGGLVVYQASWGPSNARPDSKLFSTFAVVRNPSDAWPLIACLVITLGLVFHFGRKLVRHVRLEARRS